MQRLQTFLYVLMRDSVVSGEVERIMIQVKKIGKHRVVFSNKHLAAHAKSLVRRLTEKSLFHHGRPN